MNKKTAVVLGMFDGVHLGHRALLDVASETRIAGFFPMVYTFLNHPKESILATTPQMLLSTDERMQAIRSTGITRIEADTFDDNIRFMLEETFVLMLKKRFSLGLAVVGFNYSFGIGGTGNVESLKKLGKVFGFDVKVVDAVKFKGDPVSSTRIRRCIENGNIRDANTMLTVPYSITGKVIKNKQLGTKMGFPTANITNIWNKPIPKSGVYVTRSHINGTTHNSVTYVGMNKIAGDKLPTIETHIVDFSRDIYGHLLTVEFLERLRDEVQFESVEDLSKQIAVDADESINILRNRRPAVQLGNSTKPI